MRGAHGPLKEFLNEQASRRLAQIGHSDPMIRDAKREAWWWLQARAQALKRRTGLLSGQAIVWTGPGRVELVPVEVPRAREGEVTIEMLTSVVSPGTERAQYLRQPNTAVRYPHRPGYSGAGVVRAVGPNVTHVKPGQLVVARNVPHMSVVTAPARSTYLLPSGAPVEAGAMVQLGVICGQGVRRAHIERGERVCVIGAGLVGSLAQRLAATAGSGAITVIAASRRKERAARDGGATSFLVAEADADGIAVLAAPIVIEATGDPQGLALAVEAANHGGRIILLGSPRGVTANMPVAMIRAKRLHIIGAHVATLEIESRRTGVDMAGHEAHAFLDALGTGRLRVGDLVERAIDPREADTFYRRLAESRDIVGARFDWTMLPAEDRVGTARLIRLPDLTGRGTDMERRPLAPGGRSPRRGSFFDHEDPFAGATGRLRIGLLGCGDIAVLNAAAIRAAPNAELVACYDPIAALASDVAQTHGAEIASTSDALLERKDVDAVLLSVPHHLHRPLGMAAAAAGKHVIVEKPLANTLESATELVEVVESAGVVLSVCFPQRYQPEMMTAQRLIAAGALGDLAGVMLTFLTDKPSSYWVGGYSGRAQTNWRGSREQAGGGVLIMNLSHYIDLIRHLSGVEADLVAASTAAEGKAEVEEAVSVTVHYRNGAIGSLFGSAGVRGARPTSELRLWGAEGHIVIEPSPRVYTLRALDGLRTGRWHSFGRQPHTDTRAVYFSRLASAIDDGRPPDVTGADALAVQAFIEAAYRARESGSSVNPTALLEESRS